MSFDWTIAGAVIILLFVLDLLADSFRLFEDIADRTGIDQSLVKIIIKIVAIGYLVEFSAGVVEDFGSKSIADKLVFAGKVIIFAVSVPILQSMLTLIGNFLELI